MAHPILMPKPGQMTEECVLVAWLKREGDVVKKGDVLFEIETDKSNMDVEAFEEGVLLKRLIREGETVPVNAVCAYVGEPGETVPDAAPAADPASQPVATAGATMSATAPAPAAAPLPVAAAPAATAPAPALADGTVRLRISPRASRLAADSGIDPRTLSGTGPEGRITERDVRAALAAASAIPAAPAGVAPAVAVSAPVASQTLRPAPAIEKVPEPASYEWNTDETGPRQMTRMRRVIAERLTLSATTVPQFTVTVAVDLTRLLMLRTELKAAGNALTVTDFIVFAAAQTLAEFPDVNSRTDGVSVWSRRRVHVGLAVALPDGLVVPVIRDADRRSLEDLHARAAELAEGARNGTLSPDDMAGSTFTISNLGMFGVDEFCAIINPGESAILAVSSVVPTPVAVGDGIGIRQIMKLTLTADHRLVDGELAARFLNALRRRLQDADAIRGDVLNG
jgi:pyruvate dehydrogenase E2 component (dihydrolipoyllysine-residue acetyltransferase)